MYLRWLIILLALHSATALPINTALWSQGKHFANESIQSPANLAADVGKTTYNDNCNQATLDTFYEDVKGYSAVGRTPAVLPPEATMPMNVQFDASDNGYFCGAGACSDTYDGALLSYCGIVENPGTGYDQLDGLLDCACRCDDNGFCDAFSYLPDKSSYTCYLHFEGTTTVCPAGYNQVLGVDAHVGGVYITGRHSSFRCYHKEGIDTPPQTVGLNPKCWSVVAPPAPDPVGVGDPHMTNMNGENFEIFYTGNYSLIRIPSDGALAGTFLHLHGKVANFSYLEQVSKCNPYYFNLFEMRGKGLGSAVQNMQVRRDSAGVSLDVFMVDNSTSMINQTLNSSMAFPSSKMFGFAKVSYTRKRRRNLLAFEIQPDHDPPIVVKIDWFKNDPKKPGLNILVHGLTHQLAHKTGTIGGLFGVDSHSHISSDPGIEGCSHVTEEIKT